MKPSLHAFGALTLGALIVTASLAQTASPDAPPTVPPLPTAPGQPAAPTSPAEIGRAAMPTGVTDTRPQPAAQGEAPAPRAQRAGTIEYLSGGAGAESRAALEQMQGRFALRNVFSGQGGQYVVAEKVIVRGATGPATEIANAGPMLMLALPPGRYTIEAVVGGRVQTKTVTLTQQPVLLNWSWPGA